MSEKGRFNSHASAMQNKYVNTNNNLIEKNN